MSAATDGPATSKAVDLRVRSLLNAAEDSPPGEAVEVVAKQLLASIGATEVAFFIADLSGERLVPLTRVSADGVAVTGDEAVPIGGTEAGRALIEQSTRVLPEGDGVRMYAPVTSRGDAIGVLTLRLDGSPSQRVVAQVNEAAHTLAYVIVANRRHTDLFEWGQRSHPMTLAAEIQRRLIPQAFTCEAGTFTVAGWLEPSANVAGDTFDYSVDRQALSLSMTDAMGHSVPSAMLATVAVSALRNARHAGKSLLESVTEANQALLTYANEDQFVTGIVVHVDLDTGHATIINAGHPPPYLLRGGVATITTPEVDLPLGMFDADAYRVQEFDLRDGDRLVLVTDGLLERNAEHFDIRQGLVELQNEHPREVVRRLCRHVTEACGGELEDDATILCLDWHGVATERHSSSGADD